MSDKKLGGVGDAAPSENFRPERSHTTSSIATSTNRRPRFVITFTPGPGVDAIRSLRWLLKSAKRRFGLIVTDAYEDRPVLLPIRNQVADDFRELRDEVIAERSEAWRRP